MRSIREADLRHALRFLRVVGAQSASAHRFVQIAAADCEWAVVTLDARLRITQCSDKARHWLALTADSESTRDPAALPAQIAAMVRQRADSQFGLGADQERHFTLGTGALAVTVHCLVDAGEGGTVVLLLKRARSPAQTRHWQRSLSPRQRTVLQWVAAGKSNAEVAEILSISPRTVHKHLEHVFTLLGVENRTAAVMRVFGNPAADSAESEPDANAVEHAHANLLT